MKVEDKDVHCRQSDISLVLQERETIRETTSYLEIETASGSNSRNLHPEAGYWLVRCIVMFLLVETRRAFQIEPREEKQ